MKKILAYILSSIYYLVFGFLLGIFHITQVIAWNIWGYKSQKRAVDIMNYLIIKSLFIVGAKVKYSGFEKIPEGKPLIIISNHQSQWDIPPIIWGFRKHYPKFISKIELGKGIPSISYNLKKGESALIDRKNRSQAIKEIIKLGRHIEKNDYSACIFPEGTRSKDGKVRRFKTGGLGTLLKTAPSAVVVPFAVDGNYRLQKTGFPLGIGERLTYTVLDPLDKTGKSDAEIAELAENAIKKQLAQL
jgi:1-acyl-sn-glycerol-3-phosphate acyltransferase